MWKKGESGNLSGRPKLGHSLKQFLLSVLQEPDADGTPKKILIARALVEAGLAGNVTALKEIFDRVDGPVKSRSEVSGPGGGPVVMRLEDAREELQTQLGRMAERQAIVEAGLAAAAPRGEPPA